MEQCEWLEEAVTESGCSLDFYPKYYCEFNYIEMFWGAGKAWSRANCTFSFNDHANLVPKALDSVNISKIRKFARKSYRYMDLYRIKDSGGNSLSCPQIEYAVKKYRRHRKIPLRILEIDNFVNKTPTAVFFALLILRIFSNPKLKQIKVKVTATVRKNMIA